MPSFSNVCLHTFSYELPPRILSSEAIEKRLAPVYERLKLPVGRLEMMSGIRERRLWKPGTKPSQAAAKAGQATIEKAEIDPAEIQCLLFTSVSRDMMEPATASFVHHFLGLSPGCLVLDISNACLGFLDGMILLGSMIEQGQVDNGLVVSGETAEELIESTIQTLLSDSSLTRKTIKPAFASLTIGSGSVGLYMCRNSEETVEKPRLIHSSWLANTDFSDLCLGGQSAPETTLMATDSEELLIQGIETAKQTWERFSSTSGWDDEKIDCYFCHQVGSAHARLLFERLNLSVEKNFETLPFLGNVGSVSAPVTMAMAIEDKRFIPGMKGAMLGIGSGINCLMLGVAW
ncbi:MAG: 3-oxoacyl-ACP synthase III [Desulfofustis sp.]|nr:3-oxoacyl-ACP synthase III [Desulfofustis sp.]RZW26408.1 MAG: 3-oxoacyl-ACP synthase III [Desulfobulbaceae bacterium]MBT8347064.1 3-oxoacyl-ACP synthase III [Desulfofustis sp.]MBT8355520.1 3-oxoacyl-ACP synthase III [Desulfofustis sp.]NNF45131.1 3-oxoacyl-ACP synthase III [Desulfofustis sp.]